MNILFLNSIREEIYGGMEEWIRLVGAGLAARGHGLYVMGRPESEFLRRLRNAGENLNLKSLKISGDFNPVTIGKVARFMRKYRIDIVVVNFNKDLRIGGLAARLVRRPGVVWSIGIKITRDSRIHRLLTPKLFDRVIVPSQSLKSQIVSDRYITAEKVEVIPIGLKERANNLDKETARRELRYRYSLPSDAVVAITSARFVEQKGHQTLIEAAPTIVRLIPRLHFLWLGSGPLEPKLKAKIRELNLERHFIFAGMLDDLELELSGSDFMIHPSVDEPFGLAILEGMRSGLPIIASRAGGIPEVVHEGGNAALFQPGSKEELAAAVIAVASSDETRWQLSEESLRRWQTAFSYDVMLDRVENCFRNVISLRMN